MCLKLHTKLNFRISSWEIGGEGLCWGRAPRQAGGDRIVRCGRGEERKFADFVVHPVLPG